MQISEPSPHDKKGGFSLFAYGFRPFFLAAGIYAILPLIPWAFYLSGNFYPAISLQAWHAHEMLFGFVAAGATGFLLTAIPNWTGTPALSGIRLKRLFLCWLAGRSAFWLFLFFEQSLLSYLLWIDLLLPILYGIHISRILLKTKQRRNYIFIGIMAMFAFANSLFILDFSGITNDTATPAGQFLANVVILMVAVVGGRVTPNFTRSYLHAQGIETTIRTFAWVEKLAISSLILNALFTLLMPDTMLSYGIALVAAMIHLIRFSQWASLKTWSNPLLWVLHLGYLWLIVALFLKGLEGWIELPYHLYLHAFTIGSIGLYMLGMMSRASLGHTGRALANRKAITIAYLVMFVAAILRVLTPFYPTFYSEGMIAAISLWAVSFALFLWVFAPILTRPRIDGKPG